MTKRICDKSEINNDIGLAIVKAFRLANKRAGEFKRAYAADNSDEEALNDFQKKCNELRELAEKAEEHGFKIWVNFNGKTGHTYPKDYKPTPEEDNDFDTFQMHINNQRNILNNLIFGDSQNN